MSKNILERLPSEQELDLLYLCNVDFAKELAKIPLYFCAISPDMESVPYPKQRPRTHESRSPPQQPTPPHEQEDMDNNEEFPDLCNVDFAKELAKIPLYFCAISPDMESVPYRNILQELMRVYHHLNNRLRLMNKRTWIIV
ncbi:hypothetical protein Tco_0884169 [Tanacetum coccineum]